MLGHLSWVCQLRQSPDLCLVAFRTSSRREKQDKKAAGEDGFVNRFFSRCQTALC